MKKFFLTLVIIVFLFPFGVVAYFLTQFEYDTKKLIDYKPRLSTQIFDRNGKKIANLFEKEHRYYATFDEIPARLIEALLAIEDTVFFEHPGINVDAITRAIIKDIKAGKLVEGASTITQQLVKNTLLTREKKFSRKIKELIYALKIERELTKEEILERYLNEIYLGHGYYGVKTAADGYFHKKLKDLSIKEMAILVGLPKAPSFYAPTKNYELSLGRANRVIKRMFTLGWISEKTYKNALAEKPIVYDDTLTQNRAPFIVDELLRQIPKDILKDLKTGGYKIDTTIDISLQRSGKKALIVAYNEAIKRANKAYEKGEDANDTNMSQLNGALVSIDSKTGEILALVGGIDYKESSYNRATMGKRQPGSAFKPFLYQIALDLGYSPATKLVDIAKTYSYKKDGEKMMWQPKNYEKDYKGLITLRQALVHSRNLATINLVTDIGLNTMIKELSKYGIKDLPHNLSLSLGSISLSPLKLAEYYSSFANNGMQSELYMIKEISKGDTLVFVREPKQKYITSVSQNFLLTSILHDVVEHGTGRRVRVKGIDIAGKTGTTNKSVDAWFAGYSPTITTIVWFGNDDNTPMRKKETGGRVAGPAFKSYYSDLIHLYPEVQRRFKVPENIIKITVDTKVEYATDISKPPLETSERDEKEELLF
ncbi:MAG: PBP1A family penicillin-binding protein [Helicobacteraceae bacterium]|nr:PBP1A family penicillin-binding protein [Helicobacteraceae bacterium]